MNREQRELHCLDEEIRQHIELETRELMERGMTPDAARRTALRKFGNPARAAEETRAVWRDVWLDQLLQDARYGLRVLLRNPRFSIVAVLTLALGIGINTAVFSVVNAVLLRPLDYPNPDRLVWLADYDPNLRRDFGDRAAFESWRREASSYTGMGAYGYYQAVLGTNEVTAIYTAGDFWQLTGARAAAGELCGPKDKDCLVLSWDSFQHRYGGAAHIIGSMIEVNGRPHRVAGALAASFRMQLPMWWVAEHPSPVEVFLTAPDRGTTAQGTHIFASLKPGITPAQAQAELEALHLRLIQRDGLRRVMTRLTVTPLREKLIAESRRSLLVLLASGAFVLLIACVNVACLMLARSASRRKEVAIRTAIGAGQWRVLRQFLVESLLLAGAGGLAGLLLAQWAIAVLVRVSPFAVPRLAEASIDSRVAAFALAASLLSALLFGAGSCAATLRINLQAPLKEGARSANGPFPPLLRTLLLTAELAFAILLLTGAGLLFKSYARMLAYPPGFDPAHTVTVKLRFSGPHYQTDAANAGYVQSVLRAVESESGLGPAGVSTWVLRGRLPAFPADTDPAATHVVRFRSVSPGFLPALGIRLLRGSWLPASGPQVLLNQSLARQAFGTLDPVGRQILLPRPFTVAGVVSDLKYSRLDSEAVPEAYVSLQQQPPSFYLEVAARAASGPGEHARTLRDKLAAIDPAQPVYDAKTLEDTLADSLAPRRLNLFLLASFAAVSLALCLAGVYGVMSYAVAERTREIGVRMALGARRGQVIAMVEREAARIALGGIGLGLVAAWRCTRVLSNLLYGVAPDDPQVFALVALTLGATTLAACLGPARKASAIDPASALRAD